MDRAGIALVGATLMLVTGVLSVAQAVNPDSIDYRTLLLLFGMMIIVGVLRISGFLQRLAGLTLKHVATPRGLLWRDDRDLRNPLGVFDQRRRVRRPDAARVAFGRGECDSIPCPI